MMSRVGVVLCTCVVAGMSALWAQGPPEVFPNGVVNGASFRPPDFPGGNVAPGGIISIFGRSLGPGQPVSANEFPLPVQLGPLQTRVIVNGSMDCRIISVSEGQINCQLPENVIGSQIRLRVVTSGGESEEITVPLGQVGFGLFTMNANGRGPLAAQNFTGDPDPQRRFQLNGSDNPARPGQVMVIWGTGLGRTDPPVQPGQATPGLAPAVNQPQVWVGNVQAQVQYAGRAPGFAGLDQIQLVTPENAPQGCAVPIRLQIGDQISNIGTVALGPAGQRCQDTVEDIVSGLSHGSIVLNGGLGRLGPGQLGPTPALGGPFARGPGGEMGPGGGMGPGEGMGLGGGANSGPGGVGPGGIGPFGIHPGIPPQTGLLGLGNQFGSGSLGPNVVAARFVRLEASAGIDIGVPPASGNGCVAYFQNPRDNADLFTGPVQFLDAGSLTLTGPGVDMSVFPAYTGMGILYAAPLPTALQEGTYSVNGVGGADVGPFGPAELAVPPLLTVTTSLEPGAQISRQDGLTLNWTGGNSEDVVLIHGRSFLIPPGTATPVADPMQYRSQAFVCTTTAASGQFAIPDYVLSGLPDGMLSINVTHMPSAEGVVRFQAPGLDLGGVFRWIDTTTYLDLVLEQ